METTEVELPLEAKTRILGTIDSREEKREKFNMLVEKFMRLNTDDPENFQRTRIHLTKLPNKKFNWPNPKKNFKKKLTYRERKLLGLYSVGKKSLKYKELLPLHKLWIEYMTKYINLEAFDQQKWTNSHDDPNFDQVSMKLYRADYHGSVFTVSKSTCPSYVGINGIVIMETKNCFKILGRDNIVRTVPKASCLFNFKLQNFQFEFFGKNLLTKSAERSSKKVKTVLTSDLEI